MYYFILNSILLCLPFLYLTIFGIKVILLLLLILVPCLILKCHDLYICLDCGVFLFFLAIVLCLSISSSSYKVLASMAFSFFLVYWHNLFPAFSLNKEELNKALKYYIYGVLFVSTLVILQFIAYRCDFHNHIISSLKFDHISNRVAFGATFSDYSFLSLYQFSALPLIYYRFKLCRWPLMIIVILSAVASSARTGVAAFLVFCLFMAFFGWLYSKNLYKKMLLAIPFALPVLYYTIFNLYDKYIRGGQSFINGSGRIHDYKVALNFISSHLMLGFHYGDISGYASLHGTVPHNMFIFILTFGGLLSLLIFFLWMLVVYLRIRNLNYIFIFPFIIIFIGLQVVPSPFSCYFLFFLLGIFLSYQRGASCSAFLEKNGYLA